MVAGGALRRWPGYSGRRVGVPAQGEHRDARAVHALDLEDDAIRLDGVAGFGRAPECPEHVAADGVEVLVREVELEVLVHLGDGNAAVHGVDAVPDLLDGRLPLVELVLDLPHDLLEDVLYRDEALRAPPLIYDYRHLQLALLELPQDLLYGLV